MEHVLKGSRFKDENVRGTNGRNITTPDLYWLKCVCSQKFSCKKILSYLKKLLKLLRLTIYNFSISYFVIEILRFKGNCLLLKLYRKLRKMFLSPRRESNPQPSDLRLTGDQKTDYDPD